MLQSPGNATPAGAPASGPAEPAMHEPAEIVDDRSFPSRVLEPRHPMLVLFTAEGCLPCEFLARRLPALAPELDGPFDVVRCPLETGPRTFKRYKVSRTPTLLLFKDGLRIASRVGPAPIPAIRRWVADSLARRSDIRIARANPGSGEAPGRSVMRVFFRHALDRPTVRQACRIAGVVAPALLLFDLLSLRPGSTDGYSVCRRFVLDFLIAYLVSSYSSARTAIGGDTPTPGDWS